MKPFTLYEEILGHHRTTDDEPATSVGNVAAGDHVDLLDATRPFGELFRFSISDGKASALVDRLHSDDLMSKVLGQDLYDTLKAIRPTTAAALDKRIAQISQQAVSDLIEKSVRVAAAAPLRKQAIAAIVEQAKTATAKFDSHSEESRALWNRLESSCERYVAGVLASA